MHAPKVKLRYLLLGAGLITTCSACMVIVLFWHDIKAAAVADRQQSKLAELDQAKARWQARPFSSYRLINQFLLFDGTVCERAFEVNQQAQTNVLRNTCSEGYDFYFTNVQSSFSSVPGLFDYITAEIGRVGECGSNGCACDGARTIDAVYDADLGYPKRIELRLQSDWTTRSWPQGCSLMAPNLPILVTVSMNPIK
jgi:Family of unknown function (DUF6174)